MTKPNNAELAPGEMRPLFVPLKTKFFRDFESGDKTVEYRRHGPRWNEQACPAGRKVTLSRGYSTGDLLRGVITSFETRTDVHRIPGWLECYGHSSGPAACISIALDQTKP